jgi:mannose-1-phosphate guanylyltransferase
MWGKVVLLAAVADRPETEYGWIEVGRPATQSLFDSVGKAFLVRAFHEKPEPELAAQLLTRSCLWNTMIVTAKLHDLWALARQVNRSMMTEFGRWLRVVKTTSDRDLRQRCLEEIYKEISVSDFSRDFLTHITEQCVVFPLLGIQWNDWGQAERIRDSLASIGKAPSFDLAVDTELLTSALLSSAQE